MPGWLGDGAAAAETSDEGTSPGSVNTARSLPDRPASSGRDPNPLGAPPRLPTNTKARAARTATRRCLCKEEKSLRKGLRKIKASLPGIRGRNGRVVVRAAGDGVPLACELRLTCRGALLFPKGLTQ